MLQDRLYLRKAEYTDVDLLFQWANDEVVRANAFSTEPISYEEHTKWFDDMMNSPLEVQYVLMDEEEPCGQIRFTIHGEEAEIGYSIDKSYRGTGYGKAIIQLAGDKIREDHPNIKRLIAKVKPSNVASYCCFQKNGFKEKYRQLEFDMNGI